MKIGKKLSLLAALAAASFGAQAQEAFKHLSIGLEAGTTGAGIELALPIVTDHLVLTAGYNFPTVKVKASESFPITDISKMVGDVNRKCQEAGIDDRISDRFGSSTNLNASASLNLNKFKFMLEYYPWKKASFHITAGIYAGKPEFLSADLYSEASFWSDVKASQEEVNALKRKYPDLHEVQSIDADFIDDIKVNVNGETYQLKEKDGCAYVGAFIKTAKIRPYIGLGIGRSVPKKHFGVQGDLGVAFHGNPGIGSPNKVAYDPDAPSIDEIEKAFEIAGGICFYPQLSIRFIYRIF